MLAVSAFLGLLSCAMMRQAGVEGLGASSVLTVGMGWWIVLASGVLAQKFLAAFLLDRQFTFAISAGVVLSSLALLGLSEALWVSAETAMLIWSAMVLFLVVWYRQNFTMALGFKDVESLAPVALCATFVLVWSWNSLINVGQLMETGSVSLWADCFIHATTILQYGEFRTLNRGSFEFVDTARSLYHFGSYLIPAATLRVADISGLQAAVALHLPIGLFVMFTSTHALATRIAPPPLVGVTGLLAVTLLFVLPDTSTYGLANGWFGLRWMLFSSPGSGYAIAGVLVSLIFLSEWLDRRNLVALMAAGVFAAMVFELRAHMLVWYLPAMAVCLMLGEPRIVEKIHQYRSLIAVAALAALPFASVSHYLWFVHVGNEPTAYTGLFTRVVTLVGQGFAAPLGFALLYPGMLGGLAITYPLMWFWRKKNHKPRPLDWFPLALAAIAGVIIIIAPAAPNGDQFEFKHRAFVLLYVVTLVWTTCLTVIWMDEKFTKVHAAWAVTAFVIALSILGLVHMDQFMNADRPKFNWGQQYINTPISKDLSAAAGFMRQHAKSKDVSIVMPVDLNARAADDATRFASLANVPMYLSRITMFSKSATEPRLRVYEEIRNTLAYDDARKKAKLNGIQWLVIKDGSAPRFDQRYQHAVFKQGDWAIYSMN